MKTTAFQPETGKQGAGRLWRRYSTRTASVFLALAVILATLSLAACASPSPTPSPSPAPTPTPAASRYPLTVTDILGRSVQISQKPSRIVSISPTATEMLYRVGGTAVGRDSSSRYPAEVQSLPNVGSAYAPGVEAIAALNPDLVLIEALTQGRLVATLEKLGVPVVVVRAASLDDVTQGLTLVGKVIDQNQAATGAIADVSSRIRAAAGQATSGKTILILISDADRKIYAAKPESYPGAVAGLLGMKNAAAGLADSGPYPSFALFTGEQALASNADIVFTISPAPAPAPKLSQMLPQVPGFNEMAAVKAGKVKEIDPVLFLQAQGPRIADAAEQLSQLIKEVTP